MSNKLLKLTTPSLCCLAFYAISPCAADNKPIEKAAPQGQRVASPGPGMQRKPRPSLRFGQKQSPPLREGECKTVDISGTFSRLRSWVALYLWYQTCPYGDLMHYGPLSNGNFSVGNAQVGGSIAFTNTLFGSDLLSDTVQPGQGNNNFSCEGTGFATGKCERD